MEEKHKFTTFDSVTVLGLLSAVIILVLGIVTNATLDQKPRRAKARTKQLAMQILVGGFSTSKIELVNLSAKNERGAAKDTVVSRVPANESQFSLKPEGQLGVDPWGIAYHYSIAQTDSGRTIVMVASSGPDKILQTKVGTFQIMGDDIISVERSP